jgi:hypothetical protein
VHPRFRSELEVYLHICAPDGPVPFLAEHPGPS